VEGKTVTGQAAGASFEFGLKLIEALRGADTARRVREEIYL
jgi:4-methyl-5(b-hydroxyethyl)-thiazole monophosphate biosynthesis